MKELAIKRWGSRHEMLQELRKYIDPLLYVHLPKWPTGHLKTLLEIMKNA